MNSSQNTLTDNEVLRNLIRLHIESKVRAMGPNVKLDDSMRKRLKQEVENEVKVTIVPEEQHMAPSKNGNSFKKKVKNGLKKVKDFVIPPIERPEVVYKKDTEVVHKNKTEVMYKKYTEDVNKLDMYYDENEQVELAIAMSKIDMAEEEQAQSHVPTADCSICFESSPVEQLASYGCVHRFCVECIANNLSTAIEEGRIEAFKCPQPDCEQLSTIAFVKRFVSEDMFNRYEELQMKAAVGLMDDVFYCPKTTCGAIVEGEIDVTMATCPKCSFTFCTSCSKSYHGTSDCQLTTDERAEMLQMHQDELIAEDIMSEETRNMIAIELLQREDEEWARNMREEQDQIRRQFEAERREVEAEERPHRRHKGPQRRRIEDQGRRIENQGHRMENQGRRVEDHGRRIEVQVRRNDDQRRRAEEERRQRQAFEFEEMIRENRERERRRQEELARRRRDDNMSENMVRQSSRPCPGCRAPIEKNAGCNHMTCVKCKHEFCWLCMAIWRGNDHICRSNANECKVQ